jgi:hypothetical protein
MAASTPFTPENKMGRKEMLKIAGLSGRVIALAGRIIALLLLAAYLAACASGGAGNAPEEAGATKSLPPIPKAPAGENDAQSTEPATRPQLAEPPRTFTPAPTSSPQPAATSTAEPAGAQIGGSDNPVLAIPLGGPMADRRAELSGLAWYGEQLIILPQFPDFNGEADGGFLYALPKAAILAFLDGQNEQPLEPQPVPFVAPGLSDRIAGFEGYEAIAFSGDDAYFTIEARNGEAMLGYLVKGRMAPGLAGLALDTSTLAVIAPQTNVFNIAEESLFVTDGLVGVIHELNGAKVNPAPVVHLFSPDLAPAGVAALPNVPFRVTDASAPDAAGRFWAINYFYPGSDELLEALGTPDGNANGDQVWPAWMGLGRLLEFQFSPVGITPTGTVPIQLESNLGDIHNWEGLARLDDRGFLLVSDEIPGSVLGFVPLPATE